MAFVVEEIGRSADIGDDANTERNYYASGYSTEVAATSAVLAYIVSQLGSPPNIGGQVLSRIAPTEAELVGDWRVRASWKWVEKLDPPPQCTTSTGNPTSEDSGELSFDITLDTVRVQFALETNRHEIPTLEDHFANNGTAINWNPKARVAEGLDVYDPTFGWSETHYFHESKITRTFRRNIMKCAGKTNQASFRGNAEGEVLFVGCSGRKRSKHDYALTYQFKHRENVELNLYSVPDPIPKKGWEYVETVYESDSDANKNTIIQPVGVLVHKPIESANFGLLGIGS